MIIIIMWKVLLYQIVFSLFLIILIIMILIKIHLLGSGSDWRIARPPHVRNQQNSWRYRRATGRSTAASGTGRVCSPVWLRSGHDCNTRRVASRNCRNVPDYAVSVSRRLF